MTISCQTCREQLAEQALEQTDAGLREEVSDHLRTCADCRRELAEIKAAWASLPAMLPAQSPSPELFQRIAAGLDAQPALQNTPNDASHAYRPSRRERVFSYVVAASVLVALTWGAAVFVRQAEDDAHELAAKESVEDLARRMGSLQQMEQLLKAENVRMVSLAPPQAPGAVQAYVVWDLTAEQGHLYAFDLPQPPEGFRYQAWATGRDGALAPGPKFTVNAQGLGSALLEMPATAGAAPKAVVTLEPDGDSPQPTGKVVLEASL